MRGLAARRPLRVGVTVELLRAPASGGHVKCWERFAAASVGLSETLDLTLYVLAQHEYVEPLSAGVRIVGLRPVLGTGRLTGAIGGVDSTDLSLWHPRLEALLPAHDVLHLTCDFAFGGSAVRVARRTGRPLVGSVHTDVPLLARTYLDDLVHRLPRTVAPLVDRLRPGRLPEAVLARRRAALLRACGTVLTSSQADAARTAAVVGQERVARLRRGVARERFHATDASSARTPRTGEVAVLFVGRVDASKRVRVVAEAVALLRGQGLPVRLVVAGSGADEPGLADQLGSGVDLLGHLPQAELAKVYARCDIFAFPSLSETVGNVVAEAMACGLPPVLPLGARTAQWLAAPGRDGVLVPEIDGRPGDARAWADALRPLVQDAALRGRLGQAAAHTSRQRHPTWEQVVREDLLPVWQQVAAGPRVRAA